MGSETVRIALVGAGRMGQVHLEAIGSSPALTLAGVVEPVEATRDALSARGIVAYEGLEQLLDADRPDGVLIAAPSDRHPELVAACARARMPMLCEKPVGVDTESTRAAVDTAEAAGVLLQVGYWRRFVPELGALRERIIGGDFGQIIQIACMQWDHELPSEGFRGSSGGIAVDLGVHEFDQVRWLLGQEFDWIVGTAAGPDARAFGPADPDHATLLARLSSGTAAVVSLGRRFPLDDSCWLEVWGTDGYERVPYMWGAAGQDVFVSSMRRQAEAFGAAIRGGARAGANGRDAIAAQQAAAMASAALASGQVEFPRERRFGGERPSP